MKTGKITTGRRAAREELKVGTGSQAERNEGGGRTTATGYRAEGDPLKTQDREQDREWKNSDGPQGRDGGIKKKKKKSKHRDREPDRETQRKKKQQWATGQTGRN